MVRKEAKYDHKFYEDIGEGEQTKNRYTPIYNKIDQDKEAALIHPL